ncbi:MAG: hypothetical protein IPQ13_08800 [Holophagaceae bacterium]|nr:hypothetical protein [Holophagaceae bacterium]
MATPKAKEIQVQKPAQSLAHFQKKMAQGQDLQTGMLKPLLIGASTVVLLVAGFFGFNSWRDSKLEAFESNLAEITQGFDGAGPAPLGVDQIEKTMRDRLPKLEALTKTAPGSRKASAEGLLAAWKFSLDGKGSAAAAAPAKAPWARIAQAERAIALGQGQEALALLSPLRKSASPNEDWANLYWNTLVEADRLAGNRDQAWKDFAEYKNRFKDRAVTVLMERTLQGI